MFSNSNQITIISILFIIYIALSLIVPFSVKAVDPISLSGYLNISNSSTSYDFFSNQPNMAHVTCREWNNLPKHNRNETTMRYQLITTTYDDCNPHTNKNYQSYVDIIYGSVIINLILWIIIAYITSKSVLTYDTHNKIIIGILYLLLLASLYINVYFLTSTKKLHTASYGELYNINGYVNVSNNFQLPIYDQFQLSEYVCKMWKYSAVAYVDVYLSNCSIDNSFLYSISMIIKVLSVALYIPCGIYIAVHETNKPISENTNLTI
jgi:hypothetical protein